MSLLSLVVPSHNEAESLPFLFDEINHVTQEMMQEHQDLAVEVIVVDDGSTDHTLDVLKKIQRVPIPDTSPATFLASLDFFLTKFWERSCSLCRALQRSW